MKNKFLYAVFSIVMLASASQAMTEDALSRFHYDEEQRQVVYQTRTSTSDTFYENLQQSPITEYKRRIGEIEAAIFGPKKTKYEQEILSLTKELESLMRLHNISEIPPLNSLEERMLLFQQNPKFVILMQRLEDKKRKEAACQIRRREMHDYIPSALEKALNWVYIDPNIFTLATLEETQRLGLEGLEEPNWISVHASSMLDSSEGELVNRTISKLRYYLVTSAEYNSFSAILSGKEKFEARLAKVSDEAFKARCREVFLTDEEIRDTFEKQIIKDFKIETFKIFLHTISQYKAQRIAELAEQAKDATAPVGSADEAAADQG